MLPKLKVFQSNLLACHVVTYFNCSGNLVGSAAASKACSAKIPLAVWCPCPPSPVVGKRVIITSGLNVRITQTTSLKILFCPQVLKVSSGLLLYPKSYALVKNCSAPSTLLAANNSCVRIKPKSIPCSSPIKF